MLQFLLSHDPAPALPSRLLFLLLLCAHAWFWARLLLPIRYCISMLQMCCMMFVHHIIYICPVLRPSVALFDTLYAHTLTSRAKHGLSACHTHHAMYCKCISTAGCMWHVTVTNLMTALWCLSECHAMSYCMQSVFFVHIIFARKSEIACKKS